MAFESLEVVLDSLKLEERGRNVPPSLRTAYDLMREATDIVVGEDYDTTEEVEVEVGRVFKHKEMVPTPVTKTYTEQDKLDRFSQALEALEVAKEHEIEIKFSPEGESLVGQSDYGLVAEVLEHYAAIETDVLNGNPTGAIANIERLQQTIRTTLPNSGDLLRVLSAQKAELWGEAGSFQRARQIQEQELSGDDDRYGLNKRLDATLTRAEGGSAEAVLGSIAEAYMNAPDNPDVIRELIPAIRSAATRNPQTNYRLDSTISTEAVEAYEGGQLLARRHNPMGAIQRFREAEVALGEYDPDPDKSESLTKQGFRAAVQLELGKADKFLSGIDAAIHYGMQAYEILPTPEGVNFLTDALGIKLQRVQGMAQSYGEPNRVGALSLRPPGYERKAIGPAPDPKSADGSIPMGEGPGNVGSAPGGQ